MRRKVEAAVAAEGAVRIPDSHRDLFRRPVCAVLTTLAPDGQPRSCIVWVDEVEGCARFNTTFERAKARDLRRDPRVSLLIVDPDDTSRFVQVRGDAELMTDGAEAQLDELTRRYTAYPLSLIHI